MAEIYYYHRITTSPLNWHSVAETIIAQSPVSLSPLKGKLYGIWRNQIGRPRDELNVLTVFEANNHEYNLAEKLFENVDDVTKHRCWTMQPTLKPQNSCPPDRQGNYAFRWFEMPEKNWPEFLQLCSRAWPEFESNYDSRVIGLWKINSENGDKRQALLLTRRPGLAMWEQSKIPRNQTEQNVRNQLSRRYDLCDFTVVYTTTLFTARDKVDDTRWT